MVLNSSHGQSNAFAGFVRTQLPLPATVEEFREAFKALPGKPFDDRLDRLFERLQQGYAALSPQQQEQVVEVFCTIAEDMDARGEFARFLGWSRYIFPPEIAIRVLAEYFVDHNDPLGCEIFLGGIAHLKGDRSSAIPILVDLYRALEEDTRDMSAPDAAEKNMVENRIIRYMGTFGEAGLAPLLEMQWKCQGGVGSLARIGTPEAYQCLVQAYNELPAGHSEWLEALDARQWDEYPTHMQTFILNAMRDYLQKEARPEWLNPIVGTIKAGNMTPLLPDVIALIPAAERHRIKGLPQIPGHVDARTVMWATPEQALIETAASCARFLQAEDALVGGRIRSKESELTGAMSRVQQLEWQRQQQGDSEALRAQGEKAQAELDKYKAEFLTLMEEL